MKKLSALMSFLIFLLLSLSISSAEAAIVYRIDANAISAPPALHEYDSTTNIWTERAALPATNTTQLACDGTYVYALPTNGNIYRYDANTNSWIFVQAGPAASVGQNQISMFETYNGEFYWGNDETATLYYTVGGAWNSVATPRSISSGSGIDRSAGRIYIRTFGQLGFFVYDIATNTFPSICDDTTIVNENSRVGAYYNGFFYSRTSGGNLVSFNIGNCASSDTGIALTTTHASTDVDENGNIYLNGYSPEQTFEVYSISGNNVTTLANAPLYGGNAHPSLAVLEGPELPPVPTSIPTISEWGMIIMSLILAGTAFWMIRRRQVS